MKKIIFFITCLVLSGCSTNEFKAQKGNIEVYCNSKVSDYEKILDILAKDREVISKKYLIDTKEIIKLYIYPTQFSFRIGSGLFFANENIVGFAKNNEIHMVSTESENSYHTPEEILDVATHEMVHYILYKVNKELTDYIWLDEGVATYEAGQVVQDNYIPMLLDYISPPTFEDLEKNFYQYPYDYSGLIVRFIIDNYGFDKLLELIKKPGDFDKILIQSEVFYDEWLSWIKSF